MSLVWTPALAVGIPVIDQQHAELFFRAGQLVTATRECPGSGEVYRTLAFLGDYVVSHFAQEEKLMRDVGYPAAQAHAAEHARFVARFQGYLTAFARSGPDAGLSGEVERAVCDWLVQHVSGADRLIGEHVRAAAAAAQPAWPAEPARVDVPASSPRSASAGSPPPQA